MSSPVARTSTPPTHHWQAKMWPAFCSALTACRWPSAAPARNLCNRSTTKYRSSPVKVHEYQAKEVVARFGVPVPKGRVAQTADEAKAIAAEIGAPVAVKAQIHAGGRGKGGGIKLAGNPDEAREAADRILGMQLVTHQTGPEGKLVKRVLVEEQLQVERELYMSVVIDNSIGLPIVMASAEGGVEIEEVAADRKS